MAGQNPSWQYMQHQIPRHIRRSVPANYTYVKPLNPSELVSRGVDLMPKSSEREQVQNITYLLKIGMLSDYVLGHSPLRMPPYPHAVFEFVITGGGEHSTDEDGLVPYSTDYLQLRNMQARKLTGGSGAPLISRMSTKEVDSLRDIFDEQLADFTDGTPLRERFGRMKRTVVLERILADLHAYYESVGGRVATPITPRRRS